MGFGILYLIIIIVLLCIAVTKALQPTSSHYGGNEGWWIMSVFAAVGLCVLLIGTIVANGNLISSEENVRGFQRANTIFQGRIDTMLPQLLHEWHGYSAYEKEVIEDWAHGKGQLINIPPNLENIQAVQGAVDTIQKINDAKNDNNISIINETNALRTQYRTMQLWCVYVKPIPDAYHN